MPIAAVTISLESDFQSLCEAFRDKLEKKSFHELSSVIQALRPWKNLIYSIDGQLTTAKLHSNPHDPPDVTLVFRNREVSVEHTDFDNQMRAYVRHLQHKVYPQFAIFLPPVSYTQPISREETLKAIFNPSQSWTRPIDMIQSIAFQLEECVSKKLQKYQPDFLIITDKLALDFDFDIAAMYVLARIRERQLDSGKTTIIFYTEMDTVPTRFATYWLAKQGVDVRYLNSKGLDLPSLSEIQATSALDQRWRWSIMSPLQNPPMPQPFTLDFGTSPDATEREKAFEAILLALGRLSVAYNHLDQELFDALSFLLAKESGNSADYAAATAAADAIRGFEYRSAVISNLYAIGDRNSTVAKLNTILAKARDLNETRNQFLHSRWGMPQGSKVAVRAKFKKGKDVYTDVSAEELAHAVEETEQCTSDLRDFFSAGAFSDYWEWSLNRML